MCRYGCTSGGCVTRAERASTAPRGVERPGPPGGQFVPRRLHEWQVDFAARCSYKYLNSGAGCLSAVFVHESHAGDDATYPRLAGWWGVRHAGRTRLHTAPWHGADAPPRTPSPATHSL